MLKNGLSHCLGGSGDTKKKERGSPLDEVEQVIDAEYILRMQERAAEIYIHDAIYTYMAELAKATREEEHLLSGLSPRGTVALSSMARALAWMRGRNYVTTEDVQAVFFCVSIHRIQLNTKAKVGRVSPEEVLRQVLDTVKAPSARKQ